MLHVPTDLARHAIEIRGQASPIHWSLSDIRDVLRWRRSLILGVMAAVVVAAVVYVIVTPPVFTATAVLMTDTKRSPAYGSGGTPDTSVDMVVVESQNETLKSDKIALTVIDKLRLWEDPEFVPTGPTLLSYIMGLFSPAGEKPRTKTTDIKRQIAVGNVKKALEVERAGRSYVSEISFTSTDPEKSATIANAIAEAYIIDQLSAKLQVAQRTSDWIENRVSELKKRSSEAAKALADFKSTNGIANTAGDPPGGLSQSLVAQRLRELETAAQSARTTYETFLNRYTQSVQIQQQAFPVTEARVLAEAMPPLSKSKPKTSLILLLAVVAGGTLGVIAAFAREYEQRLVRAPRQLERELRVRVLGAIPTVKRRRLLSRRGPLHLIEAHKSSVPFGGSKAPPLSLAGESLRGIKVALERIGSDKGSVIGVTSPRAGAGKTTLAYNIASLSAQCGNRTLLIDGDLRRLALTRSLTPKRKLGLASLMAGNADMAECITEHRPYFYFLGEAAGSEATAHPSEVLSSDAMIAMIDGLKKTFDTIIIDLPPVLDCVDVRASAHAIGVFILVTEWGKTSVEDLDRALASSDIIVERLLGVAINKVAAAEFGRRH
jgi:capsular exopolysaccharide synthesis family protein